MNNEGPDGREVRPGNYQRETTPLWFVIGAVVVAAFSAYYIYRFWGGLGPGVLH